MITTYSIENLQISSNNDQFLHWYCMVYIDSSYSILHGECMA